MEDLIACRSSDEHHECNGICEQAQLYGIESVCKCVKDNEDLESILYSHGLFDYFYLSVHGNSEGLASEDGKVNMSWQKLATMGWHCITVWECELTEQRVQNDAGISSAESRGKKTEGQLKPLTKREQTLDSLAFTLNHIWLQDHGATSLPYPKPEEDLQMPMAAESAD